MYSKGVITIFVAESAIRITVKTKGSKSRFITIDMSSKCILVGCIQPEVLKFTAITIDGNGNRFMWCSSFRSALFYFIGRGITIRICGFFL